MILHGKQISTRPFSIFSRNVRDVEVPSTSDQLHHVSQLSDGFQQLRLNPEDTINGRGVDAVDSRYVAAFPHVTSL